MNQQTNIPYRTWNIIPRPGRRELGKVRFNKVGHETYEIVEIENEEIKKLDEKDINRIKEKYLKRLDNIEEKLNSNKISVRHAYQMLSANIRYFVFEVTNIKVQNYTLREIEKLKMPILSELIEEYYAPEFAEYSVGNIKTSLEKTRKVIEKWN